MTRNLSIRLVTVLYKSTSYPGSAARRQRFPLLSAEFYKGGESTGPRGALGRGSPGAGGGMAARCVLVDSMSYTGTGARSERSPLLSAEFYAGGGSPGAGGGTAARLGHFDSTSYRGTAARRHFPPLRGAEIRAGGESGTAGRCVLVDSMSYAGNGARRRCSARPDSGFTVGGEGLAAFGSGARGSAT